MNESTKTAIFLGIAGLTSILAWMAMPETGGSQKDEAQQRVGQDVFLKFQDPEVATSMQITKYDADLAQVEDFEVARDPKSKLWSLPSRSGYPADAAEQVRDATTPLIGLKVLEVPSDLPSDHELYGVVNPDDDKLRAGSKGVGMLVSLKDDSDKVLASLIVGKEEQSSGLRFVRIPTEDAVYKVELDTAAFTTNFQDWIEDELLGVRSMDINKVKVRDYKLSQTIEGWALTRNFDATVSYETSGGQWEMDQLVEYDLEGPKDKSLAEDEELNRTFLNALRTAVQDLQIVDVKRKPEGLAVNLVADESLLRDAERLENLQDQGFLAIPGKDATDILSVGGETIIGTEDGVEYVLRFGEATATLASDEGESLRRYLMVAAQVDQDAFPLPELQPVPETVEEMLAMEKAAEEAANPKPMAEIPELDPADIPIVNGDEGATEASESSEEEMQAEGGEPAAEDAPEESGQDTPEEPKEPAGEPTEDPAVEAGAEETSAAEETPTEETPATDEPKSESGDGSAGGDEDEFLDDCGMQEEAEATASDDQDDSSETSTDPDPTAQESESEANPAGESAPQETVEDLKERLEALRDEISRENQRKLDAHKEQMEEAQKKVLELNARFGLWYYVVADSVYKKLKISRDDLITKKTAVEPPAGAGLPAPPPGLGNFNPLAPTSPAGAAAQPASGDQP